MMNFEEHKKCGEWLKIARRNALCVLGSVSGAYSATSQEYNKAQQLVYAITKLKSLLDGKMFQEFPDKDPNDLINIYYGLTQDDLAQKTQYSSSSVGIITGWAEMACCYLIKRDRRA